MVQSTATKISFIKCNVQESLLGAPWKSGRAVTLGTPGPRCLPTRGPYASPPPHPHGPVALARRVLACRSRCPVPLFQQTAARTAGPAAVASKRPILIEFHVRTAVRVLGPPGAVRTTRRALPSGMPQARAAGQASSREAQFLEEQDEVVFVWASINL